MNIKSDAATEHLGGANKINNLLSLSIDEFETGQSRQKQIAYNRPSKNTFKRLKQF